MKSISTLTAHAFRGPDFMNTPSLIRWGLLLLALVLAVGALLLGIHSVPSDSPADASLQVYAALAHGGALPV